MYGDKAAGSRAGRVLAAGSIHDVFSKPLPPLCGFLSAQLGVNVDLLFPLRRRREDAGKLGYFRINLGIEHRGATLLQLGNFCLNIRIVERIDEFVSEFGLLRAFLHDDTATTEN